MSEDQSNMFRFFESLGEVEVRRRMQPHVSDKWNDPYSRHAAQWIALKDEERSEAVETEARSRRAEDMALNSRAADAAERSAAAAEDAAASARDANSIAIEAKALARAANDLARQNNQNTRNAWIAAAVSAIIAALAFVLKR